MNIVKITELYTLKWLTLLCELYLKKFLELLLVVQWLRLWAANTGCAGWIPDRGTKILQAVRHAKNFFKRKGRASLVVQLVKNLPAMQETRFNPWVGKMPWRREWLPTPVFLPGEYHGQRRLAGYSPQGRKESDTTATELNWTEILGGAVKWCSHNENGLRVKSLQSCSTHCDPVDCSLPVSSVHGILQARLSEWVAMSSSRDLPKSRDQTHVS